MIGRKAEKKLLKIISHSHRKKKKLEGNAEVMLEQISHALTYFCFHLFYAWEVVRTDNYEGRCLNTKQRANPSSTSFIKGRKHASSQLHAFIGQVHIQYNLYNTPKLPACIFVAREQANSRIIFAGRLKVTGELCLPDLVSMLLLTCQQSIEYQHAQMKISWTFKKKQVFFLHQGWWQ